MVIRYVKTKYKLFGLPQLSFHSYVNHVQLGSLKILRNLAFFSKLLHHIFELKKENVTLFGNTTHTFWELCFASLYQEGRIRNLISIEDKLARKSTVRAAICFIFVLINVIIFVKWALLNELVPVSEK